MQTKVIVSRAESLTNFCSTHNINLHLIATGSARANGQVERVMSTLKNMLTAVETSNRTWQDALPDVQLALNCTQSRVTKHSSLELLIGKVARPVEMLVSDEIEPLVNLDEVRNEAFCNIEKMLVMIRSDLIVLSLDWTILL